MVHDRDMVAQRRVSSEAERSDTDDSQYPRALAEAALRAASIAVSYAMHASKASKPDARQFLTAIARQKWVHHELLESMAGNAGIALTFGMEAGSHKEFHRPPENPDAAVSEVFPFVYNNAIEDADLYGVLALSARETNLRELYETLLDWSRDFLFTCRVAYLESLSDHSCGTMAA